MFKLVLFSELKQGVLDLGLHISLGLLFDKNSHIVSISVNIYKKNNTITSFHNVLLYIKMLLNNTTKSIKLLHYF